jgi:eukaryotic-like serine/threonine-protein kinase
VVKLASRQWLAGTNSSLGRPTKTAMAFSNDGRFVVYGAVAENPTPDVKPQLYLRRMDEMDARPIAGTEGGGSPFLSPDDRWIGFWADGKLLKVSVEGGVPAPLCDVRNLLGCSWGFDNQIIFSMSEVPGLSGVPENGGKPDLLTQPDKTKEESSHRLPHCLPNGKSVLFTITKHDWDIQPRTAILDLKTRKWSTLINNAADARYVPTGHIVFLRQGTLMAVPFDLTKLELRGQPSPVIADVMQSMNGFSSLEGVGAGQMSVSNAGSLVYSTGGIFPDREFSLSWVDLNGVAKPIISSKGPVGAPRLSPDGGRIAYTLWGLQQGAYVYDIARGTTSRLTDEGRPPNAVWTPDGTRVVFNRHVDTKLGLFWMPADGSSPAEPLLLSGKDNWPGSFSPDGRTLVYVETNPVDSDLFLLDLRSRRAEPFLNSRFRESFPEFSPDGHWLAFSSNESGRPEVYVRPFPGPGGRWQVSHEGGTENVWARDGKRLFYRSRGKVWVVDIRTDTGFLAGKPRLLFEHAKYFLGSPLRLFDVSPDGQRFLMMLPGEREPRPATEMILVQNWFEELKRLVPTK